MLVNTGKKDKNGNVIYVNKLTGKKEIALRVRYFIGKHIPSHAYSFIFNPLKNPQPKF